MDLFTLVAKLGLDSSEYDRGLGDANEKAYKLGSGIGTVLNKGAKIGAAAIAAVGTAAAATGTALVKGASDTASYGDNIDKMSQKMGLSAEAYQEWDAIMQHSGTSIESLQAGMKTLANAVEKGNESFERIGITEEQIASMNNEELFSAVISGLQNVDNETERTYLAGQLLGRGATELGALLNTSAEDTEAMRQRVHELGGVMSDEAVKASAKFQDNLQDLQTAMAGIKRGITGDFLPGLNDLMDGFTRVLTGEDYADEMIGSGIGWILDAVEKTVDKAGVLFERIVPTITEVIVEELPGLVEALTGIVGTLGQSFLDTLPALIDAASSIIQSIVQGITEGIPELIPAVIEIVLSLVDMLIDNLPMLVEAAAQIILALALGIADALPDLIPTIMNVVLEIVEVLIDNVDLLVDAAVAIIVGLSEGIIDALPVLIEKAPEIVVKLVEAIIKNAPKLIQAAVELVLMLITGIVESFGKVIEIGAQIVEKVKSGFKQKVQDARNWGRDMIQNFINGILDKWNNLKRTVSNVAQTVKNFLGFSEPKEGPLSNFHTYGPDMMELYSKGIRDNAWRVTGAMNDALDFSDTSPKLPSGGVSVLSQVAATTTATARDLTVILELDKTQLAKAVYSLNNAETQRVGVRLAGGYA